MQQPTDKSSRKKFLWWGAAAAASVAVFKFFGKSGKRKETVKMLAQDGTLVEVDKELLRNSKKISDAELKVWVNNKSTNQ